MPKFLVVAALAAALPLAAAAQAQESARYVEVDGKASISVMPDIATLSMAVEARSPNIDTARAEVVEVTRRVTEFVRGQGVDGDDVRTTGLDIRPEYRWNDDENRQELLGYVVRRSIEVRLTEIDELGVVMEGAVDAGVNQVQPPRLGRTDERELKRRALAAATRDARANAQQIAATLGAELGPVRRVTASETVLPRPPYERAMMSEAAAGAADSYSTGRIEIEARVSAEFELVTGE